MIKKNLKENMRRISSTKYRGESGIKEGVKKKHVIFKKQKERNKEEREKLMP